MVFGQVWNAAANKYDYGKALYLNEGGRLASLPAWLSHDSARARCILLADFNGDGRLDAAFGFGTAFAPAPDRIQVFLNTNGTFRATPDFDGDGQRDLVALRADTGAAAVLIYRNHNGQFEAAASITNALPKSGDGYDAYLPALLSGGS